MRIKSYAAALFGIAAVSATGAFTTARADSVLVDGTFGNSYGRTYFNDYGSAFGGVYRPITSLRLSNATDAVSSGGDSATTTYNLGGDGFDVNIGLSRIGAQSSFAGFGINIYFTASDSTTSYSMSGSYAFTSPFALVQSYVVDLSGGFGANGYQYISQSDGMFSAGGGDQTQYNSGSFSGSLIANHHYLWHSDASIQALSSAAGGASASGNMRISFSDVVGAPADVTPSPSAAVGGLTLLAGLGAFGGRRRPRIAQAI
jgi:hypothetical protein